MPHAGLRARHAVAGLLAGAALLPTVVGCAPAGFGAQATENASPTPATPTTGLTVEDPWVKAADEGMTAVFGTLVNDGEADVTVVSAASTVSLVEIHEMAMSDGQMVMRRKEGGLTVPAGTRHTLEPGGDHLMLMDLSRPVPPGDEVTVTLHLADGGTVTFTAIAKPFAGAEETYHPDAR